MTQTRATDPQVIYDTLTGDSEFMELVGSRIFSVGDTELDAISIVTPGEELPALKSISGLEVVVQDIANMGRRQYLTGDTDITTTWRVYLMAWQGATGATLTNASMRIMELFSNAVTIETAKTPEGIGAIAQVLVLIPSDSVITT